MEEQRGAEWESCKNNVQPLRQSGAVSTSHHVSSQHPGSRQAIIQQQRQAFESELQAYSGDDPLDVWDRYLKWTLQTYPKGSKESNLSVILEGAVMQFADEKKYYNDARYVNLWIKLAENSTEPLDIYGYMHTQQIGIMQAALYIAWAVELEKRGDCKRADAIYQEGVRCRAEPFEKLQQHQKSFQVRVSHQAVDSAGDTGTKEQRPEPTAPLGTSLVDMRPRGKRKAVAHTGRAGASVSRLSLKLPASNCNSQTSCVPMLDNSQAGVLNTESFEPTSVPLTAPPNCHTKENDLMPEKWADFKTPQKPRSGHSAVALPSKPNLKPFVEETDQPPAGSPAKTSQVADLVVSARGRPPEEAPVEHSEMQRPVEGQAQECSMYCKGLLLLGSGTELSFEELRAERYRKRMAQELEEKEVQLRQLKEELRLQIEEKQRLLQERSQQTAAQHQPSVVPIDLPKQTLASQPGCSPPELRRSTSGFKVLGEWESSSSLPPGVCPPSQDDDVYADDVFVSPSEQDMFIPVSGDTAPSLQAEKSFTIFDESSMCEPSLDRAPVSASSKLSKRRPLAVIREPLGGASSTEPDAESPTLESSGMEPSKEDAIVDGYRNKTLCPSPEDTGDFARATKMASTPFGGGSGQKPRPSMGSGPAQSVRDCTPKTTKDVPKETPARTDLKAKKLSPIQEASMEDRCSASSSSSASSTSSVGGHSCLKATSLSTEQEMDQDEMSHAAPERADETLMPDVEMELEDPCSASVRRQLLEGADLSSLEGFHSKLEPLPPVNESDVLFPGDEAFIIASKIISNESHILYSGIGNNSLTVKMDFQPIPWDFYIDAQLRKRLDSDSLQRCSNRTSCFLYSDGCITISHRPHRSTLQEFVVSSPPLHDYAVPLVMELLELVERMHACHLVHGDLRPETLALRNSAECDGGSGVLNMLDFSCCLDLDLQLEVTSCRGLPAAQAFVKRGVLSPSSAPYQIDLLGVAETVHMMLTRKSMELVRKGGEWKLAGDGVACPGNPSEVAWREFFRKILNPGTRSTVAVLTELQNDLKTHFAAWLDVPITVIL